MPLLPNDYTGYMVAGRLSLEHTQIYYVIKITTWKATQHTTHLPEGSHASISGVIKDVQYYSLENLCTFNILFP